MAAQKRLQLKNNVLALAAAGIAGPAPVLSGAAGVFVSVEGVAQ
jgi:hypothetical protein